MDNGQAIVVMLSIKFQNMILKGYIMAQFKECHLALSKTGQTIFINVDNIAVMRPSEKGTVIVMIGIPEDTYFVTETPSEIIG